STARLMSGEMAAYGAHVQATRAGLPRIRWRARFSSMKAVVLGCSRARRATSGHVTASHAAQSAIAARTARKRRNAQRERGLDLAMGQAARLSIPRPGTPLFFRRVSSMFRGLLRESAHPDSKGDHAMPPVD